MDITPAKRNALVDALLFGDIWTIQRGDYRWKAGDRYHHRVTINRLVTAGLLEYNSRFNESGGVYAGGYVLTDKGRAVARSLDDTESSASRQHYIDTGAYLTYADREELNPPQFAVGATIKNKRNPKEHPFLVVRRTFSDRMWWYSVEVTEGKYKGTLFDQVLLNPDIYEVVPDEVERDWELLAPVAAQAATLVALGRGDELVEDYSDGVITAWELLDQLVKAGQ
jgi:hypothetical protein